MISAEFNPTGRTHLHREPGSAGSLYAAIGRRIKARRKALGWTQRDLAEKTGIAPNFISETENGHRGMQVRTLVTFAKALGVRTDHLIGE
jgi:transcriptional regulator with XRE-family HTH domain